MAALPVSSAPAPTSDFPFRADLWKKSCALNGITAGTVRKDHPNYPLVKDVFNALCKNTPAPSADEQLKINIELEKPAKDAFVANWGEAATQSGVKNKFAKKGTAEYAIIKAKYDELFNQK